jgi:sRNA-binding carbon storage regulator CsrA
MLWSPSSASKAINQVRLGIAAPQDIVVDRKEVHDRKLRESRVNTLRSPKSQPLATAT